MQKLLYQATITPPEAYTQNSKFIDDAQKEIYSLLAGIKRDVECI